MRRKEKPQVHFDRFVPLLTEILTVLRKYRREAQAGVIERLIELAEDRSPDFLPKLLENDIWGGAGSVADVMLGYDDLSNLEELIDENSKFMRLLISLADEIRKQGVRDPDIERLADAFRRSLAEPPRL